MPKGAYKDLEKRRAYQKAYREAHRKEVLGYRKVYDALHREQRKSYFKTYRETHKEERRIRAKEWRESHKEHERIRRSAYLQTHRLETNIAVYKWRKAHVTKEVANGYCQTRRARIHHAFIEKVQASEVYKRDLGVCGICHKKVSLITFTLDHILPLAKGGEHSYRNIQIAHKACNSRKGNRTTIPQQLRLVG